jgi:hypothetical protein
MQGFVSGVNMNGLRDGVHKNYYNLGTISNEEQWGFVIGFCRRNPDKTFAHAMQILECKPCGLMVAGEALRGSMRPLIERRSSY